MTLFERHVSRLLPLVDSGELPAAARARVNRHLATCRRCREELSDIRFAAGVMRRVARAEAPDAIWTSLTAALDRRAAVGTAVSARRTGMPRWQWAAVAATLAAVAIVIATLSTRLFPAEGRWTVTGPGMAAAATGDWVETAAATRARITVGTIGTVDVEPASRVRLAAASDSEYRLELTRGTIRAQILAPPRLFVVDTPATTVVDLGCAYTVRVAEDGSGEIVVTEGWTALESPGRESLVPAGAFCRLRSASGPGTPYFTDAPARLRQAVEAFDAGATDAVALGGLLAAARPRDTLTLWHLVSRVTPDLRPMVVDRIDELVPPPSTVVRERVLALDADTLRRWRLELAWKW